MNFDSPSDLRKNLENLFGSGSPDSPSFLPKAATKSLKRLSRPRPAPLSTRSLNTLLSTDNYDSPATTLAADLSQNFHIQEQSVKTVPTPKRSLVFNQTQLLEGITLINNQHSSEDQSPLISRQLPMRQPIRPSLLNHDSSSSRDSSRTTSHASMSSISSITSISSVEDTLCSSATAPTFPKSRKTLRRAKTSVTGTSRLFHSLSTSTLDLSRTTKFSASDDDDDKNSSDDMASKLSKTIHMNLNDLDDLDDFPDLYDDDNDLDKLCVPSPIPERSFEDSDPRKDSLGGLNKRDCGSPLQKKPIRSKVRRIHSMFYSKKEITDTTNMFGNLMGSPKANELSLVEEPGSALSNSVLEKSKIEFFHVKNDSIPRITADTLCKILDGAYCEFFSEVNIIDCRFEYEYKGGHIDGSINVSSQQELEDRFVHKRSTNNFQHGKKKSLIVFHCEFSSYRGPLMASHLRTCDRNVNQDNYPHLDYPDILILEGGYKSFFDRQPDRCYPQTYVEMNDDKHKNVCEKEMDRFRRDLKRASSFNSLSYTASISSSTSSNPRGLHRRTATSTGITFARRSSLKTHTLDFSRSSVELMTTTTTEKKTLTSDDQGKPPASLNFAFKFPTEPASMTTLPMSPSDPLKDHTMQPSGLIRKKLSRSFTLNM